MKSGTIMKIKHGGCALLGDENTIIETLECNTPVIVLACEQLDRWGPIPGTEVIAPSGRVGWVLARSLECHETR